MGKTKKKPTSPPRWVVKHPVRGGETLIVKGTATLPAMLRALSERLRAFATLVLAAGVRTPGGYSIGALPAASELLSMIQLMAASAYSGLCPTPEHATLDALKVAGKRAVAWHAAPPPEAEALGAVLRRLMLLIPPEQIVTPEHLGRVRSAGEMFDEVAQRETKPPEKPLPTPQVGTLKPRDWIRNERAVERLREETGTGSKSHVTRLVDGKELDPVYDGQRRVGVTLKSLERYLSELKTEHDDE